MKFNPQSILITSLISLLLIASCITYLSYHQSIFKGNDPTAELRNIGLILIAIGGVPFLILGHINKRMDLESKRDDLMFKTDVAMFETLMAQIDSSHSGLIKLLTKEKRMGIVAASKEEGIQFNNAQEVSKFYVGLNSLITMPKEINEDLKNSYKDWPELNKITSTAINIFRVTARIRNEELRNLISIKIVSTFNESDLELIFFTSVIFDGTNDQLVKSNSQFMKNRLNNIEFDGLISDQFLDKLDEIQKVYFKIGF